MNKKKFTSISLVGVGLIVTPFIVLNNYENNKQNNDNSLELLQNNLSSKPENKNTFSGQILTNSTVKMLGWDKKTSITLADWKQSAPYVNQIGTATDELGAFSMSQASSIEIPNQVKSFGKKAFSGTNFLTMTFEENSQLTEIGTQCFITSQFKTLAIPKTLQKINNQAFFASPIENFIGLENTALTHIGDGAFSYSSRLKEIALPNRPGIVVGNSIFDTIPSLEKISLHRSLESSIGTWGKGLYPRQIKNINWYLLKFVGKILLRQNIIEMGWDKKTSITLADWKEWAPNATKIGPYTTPDNIEGSQGTGAFFENNILQSIAIPDTITTIGWNAFYNALALSEVIFSPNSQLSIIGPQAFYGLSKILNFSVPNQVQIIGNSAFRNSGIRSVDLSTNLVLTNILDQAFSGSGLQSIKLPNRTGVTLGDSVFNSTTNLSSISLHRSLESSIGIWGKGMSPNQIKDINWYLLKFFGEALSRINVIEMGWDKKTSITLADWKEWAPNVTKIGSDISDLNATDGPFQGNKVLQSIDIPDQVTIIGNKTFSGSNISIANLSPNSKLTTIFDYAFESTTNLINIYIPIGFKIIGQKSFLNSNISTVANLENSALTNIGPEAFSNSGLQSIKLPDRSGITLGNAIFSNTLKLAEISINRSLELSLETWGQGLTNLQKENIMWYTHKFLGDVLLTENVFYLGWHQKTSITLADWKEWAPNVTKIGTEISNIKNNVGPFQGNKVLQSIDIPDQVTIIGNKAFSGSNISVANLSPSSKLITMFDYAFESTTNLSNLYIPIGLEIIGQRSFLNSNISTVANLENSAIKNIGLEAFSGSNLLSIKIPNRPGIILGKSVFSNTLKLKQISVPRSLEVDIQNWGKGLSPEQILNLAWYQEKFLGTTLLRQDVINLGWDSRTSITLADWETLAPNVTSIGLVRIEDAPFYQNQILQSIQIPAKIRNIGHSSFQYASALTNVTFADNSSLNIISNNAFSDQLSLVTIILPALLMDLGEYAFANSKIQNVIFQKNSELKSIGRGAFQNSELVEIEIPKSVIQIGDNAFFQTKKLVGDKILLPDKFAVDNTLLPPFGLTEEQWAKVPKIIILGKEAPMSLPKIIILSSLCGLIGIAIIINTIVYVRVKKDKNVQKFKLVVDEDFASAMDNNLIE